MAEPGPATNGPEADLVEGLCVTFPSLARARDAQVRMAGEFSPLAFMGDVGRHIEGLHAAAELEGAPLEGELVRLCAFLSGAHAVGTGEVKQMVEAAFLQSFDAPSTSYGAIRMFLGPALRAAVESAWPGVDFA